MLRAISVFTVTIVLGLLAFGAPPKVGEHAPPFELASTTGGNVALKDYAGKSKLVLIFYRGYW